MLQMRPAQMEAFRNAAGKRFETTLAAALRQRLPSLVHAIGEGGLRRFVSLGVERAGAWGFHDLRSVWYYLRVMVWLGSHFDRDQQFPWARGILGEPAADGVPKRAKRLYKSTLAYWRLIAGENGAYLAEARTYIAGRDPALCLGLSGSLADHQTLSDRLALVHWQRYAVHGDRAMLLLTSTGLGQSAHLGLRTPLDRAVFVLLQFLLGSHFAEDPQFPWTARLMRRAAKGERGVGEALYGELVSHLSTCHFESFQGQRSRTTTTRDVVRSAPAQGRVSERGREDHLRPSASWTRTV